MDDSGDYIYKYNPCTPIQCGGGYGPFGGPAAVSIFVITEYYL